MKKKQNILIIDDEAPIRRLIRQKLTAEGYSCDEAESAQQALKKLDRGVALVLLDIKMPGKSGTDVLPEIRSVSPDTVVIMTTAVTDLKIALDCIRHGAYDYLPKPFNLDGLVLTVGHALERKRLELENQDYQLHLEQKVAEQAKKIRADFLNAVTALAYALEAKDRYTSGHSQRVSQIALAIAHEMNEPSEAIEKIRLAGLIHDIGKIGISDILLNKPGKLNDDEYGYIKGHCEVGERILAPIVADIDILITVRNHHEHYNGGGYPDGLAGQQIPLGSRILMVADTFDAMTSERPYRRALSAETACAEIKRCIESQFDPEVVEAFLRIQACFGRPTRD